MGGSADRIVAAVEHRPGEGQISRLKTINRTMYGRANFDLLRRRVLLAPETTQRAEEPNFGSSARCVVLH
jgi:hypothetical protein